MKGVTSLQLTTSEPNVRYIKVGDTIRYQSKVSKLIHNFKVDSISKYNVSLSCLIPKLYYKYTAYESIMIREGKPVLPVSESASHILVDDLSSSIFIK